MAKTIADVTGIKPDPRTFAPTDQLVDNTTRVGIEQEVESAGPLKVKLSTMRLWKQVSEHSLRNNGIEVVTPPLMGKDILTALQEFHDAVNGTSVEVSERCGVHVHIDFRDVPMSQLFRFIVTYLVFERPLLRMCGEYRHLNPYCAPLYSLADVVEALPVFNGASRDQQFSAIRHHPKYSAMNLQPLARLGSIEFRAHEGTLDTARIHTWVNVLLAIKQFSAKRIAPQSIIDRVCASPEKLVSDVFQGTMPLPLDDLFLEEMLEGARVAQQMYRGRELPPYSGEDSLCRELYPPSTDGEDILTVTQRRREAVRPPPAMPSYLDVIGD